MISDDKLSILQCPICKNDLLQDGAYLICDSCNSRFPVIGNIIVFLTQDDLASFLNETWGNELQKWSASFSTGLSFISNEEPIESLEQIYAEATTEGRGTQLYNTGVFPEDSDLPEELNRAVEKSRDNIVELASARSVKRVLDWSTGNGYCLHYLANQVESGTLVVALDVNFRTLAKIKPYYDKYGFSNNMLFVVADARRMPFKDGVFQSVTALGGTCEIENAEAAFRETYRVLEENGWFGVSGEQYKEDSPSMKIARQLGLDSLITKNRLEAVMKLIGFRNLGYEVLYQGYDTDDNLSDEERCPLPARGDWFEIVAASGQK